MVGAAGGAVVAIAGRPVVNAFGTSGFGTSAVGTSEPGAAAPAASATALEEDTAESVLGDWPAGRTNTVGLVASLEDAPHPAPQAAIIAMRQHIECPRVRRTNIVGKNIDSGQKDDRNPVGAGFRSLF